MYLKKLHIVWLGPVVNEETMLANLAVSPAANRWQYGLLTALQAVGAEIYTISHIPEPMWPKGGLLVGANEGMLAKEIRGTLVRYWNLPRWRHRSISSNYLVALRHHCEEVGQPTVVISYNASPANCFIGEYAQKELGIPWVCVVADDEAPPNADGLVFLSWGYYSRFKHRRKLHLDGGVGSLKYSMESVINFEPVVKPHRILYTGSMAPYAGVSFLGQAFRKIQNNDVELWICGKGRNRELERLAAIDSRIKILGFVTEEQLKDISHSASIFVNPRLSDFVENKTNFPSKILEYLSYGKPVISNWTTGLSPEYKEVLVVPEEESIGSLAQTIETVLTYSSRRRKGLAERITKFLKNERSWEVQANKLRNWVDMNFINI